MYYSIKVRYRKALRPQPKALGGIILIIPKSSAQHALATLAS